MAYSTPCPNCDCNLDPGEKCDCTKRAHERASSGERGVDEMTQCERILQYINENGSITQMDALREFGCMRLASRISDLKKAGYPLERGMETSKNRYGECVSYARYRLGVEPKK